MRSWIAHLYDHLNSAWNGRRLDASAGLSLTRRQFKRLSRFPTDLDDMMPFSHDARRRY
ncbi:MAG: hypothetical protein KF884_02435 [Fimbriimonadaceae bacterium]|nr:hypothetical protein [Fimbriimonadaceae bacterium]QYK58953.1 MAG: hypothetical protein KF884_02435 [Fimbriimonadaceae bacterium]